MSVASNKVILDRMEWATGESPLALFRMSDNTVDCVFASTVEGQKRISQQHSGYIASIHSGMNRSDVDTILASANRGSL